MELGRFTEALAPADVVAYAPVDVTDLAYDARSVVAGSLFFCVPARAPTGTTSRRRRSRAGRSRSSASGRSTCRCRSSSSRACAGRWGRRRRSSSATRARACGRGDHRHRRQDDDVLPPVEILAAAGRRPGAARLDRAARRRRAPAGRAEHAGGDRPAAAPPRDGRRGQRRLRDRGDLDRARRRGGSTASASRCSSSRT